MPAILDYDYQDKDVLEHLTRVYKAAFNQYDLDDVVRYIEEQTFLNGDRFSFLNHEFQKDIISDTSEEVNVQKCAQVGLSEIMARYALAICRVMPYFNTLLTMPGAADSEKFFKTRIDAVIRDSPDLQDYLNPDIDNTTMKDFSGSVLYGRGTRGATAGISVAVDMLIHDELDKSDPHTIQQMVSRIKHSKWKMIRRFGTPTFNGTGIALAMSKSLRKHHMCKCNHCNEWFMPNYHTNVVIPGYDRPKNEITPHNLSSIAWEKAYVCCPKCGKEPSLAPAHRSWVVENPNDPYTAKGYYVTPFSAPIIVPTSRIVKESTLFTWDEFLNQTLGETSASEASTLTEGDITACCYTEGSLESANMHAMGVDLGAVCWITIGRRTQDGRLLVVHRERCQLSDLKTTRTHLMARYRVLVSVWDWQPYTDLVMGLQEVDLNLFAGRYGPTNDTRTYKVLTKEESVNEGLMGLKMAVISREAHFDALMYMFKNRRVVWQSQGEAEDKLFVAQMTDMKREMVADKYGEATFKWQKAANDHDHYHHSLGYLNTATQLMDTAVATLPLDGLPMFGRVKVASRKETQVYGSMR